MPTGKADKMVPVIRDNRLNKETAADTWRVLYYDEPIASMMRSSEDNINNNPSAGIVEMWSEILHKLGKEKASKVQGKRIKAQRKRRRRNKNVKTVWRSYD